ncbi:glycogen debranching N-terminal domain-containing protein [Streptomyces sp. WMMB 322]|uniref:amylo-alpha-1,6-glucosidase n=1 Tax=Streptomyces sp. WMMB 322 TaxID=1286821 RepID=UPI0006E1CFED|nr:glycogen debranching N-terminal domain-containing protein [Streptomyces sp. WMMB 322]SCK45543.1 Glycogen debranching enzyme (alpha-1,6-glucosidase) [Streptomyces sp. WMMB 322]
METTVKTQDGTGAPSTSAPAAELQPFLQDACITLRAPSMAVSRPDGQISEGCDGFYHGDRRGLSLLTVRAEDVPNAPVSGGPDSAEMASFRTVLRGLAEHSPDPAVTLERRRAVEPGELEETITLHNAGLTAVQVLLTLRAGSDLASMETIKSGRGVAEVTPVREEDGLSWSDGELTSRLSCTPAPDAVEQAPAGAAELRYSIELGARESWQATVRCVIDDEKGAAFLPATARARADFASGAALTTADRGLDQWFARSCSDLRSMLLADPLEENDTFLAAGAPWFLTLFGRDSIWAARMLLPLGTGLAAGTLRTLARRQGAVSDPGTEEQPGKILHEIRRDGLDFGNGLSVPPCYYGTVDATPLWVTLLHDAWRWGMPAEEVERLLPHAESALVWMDEHGDADGDGFLEYVDSTGRGLSNQGWKDSGDSVRHRDGRLAEPPVALCEVQAYAHEAALAAAELLRAFGRPDADRWEEWAQRMRGRFRERFWVEDADGPYPAIALGSDKQPLDALTSNIGHLLGTGLLDAEESRLVAARLAGPHLDSGFGLRTLAADSGGFSPLGYHIGTVWPHDTAIAVQGLVRDGHHAAAESLAAGLVNASVSFDGRLPELFAGYGTDTDTRPVPYPASCRPQAWAATSAVAVLQAVLGLQADAPSGRLTVRPRMAGGYVPLRARGLRLGEREFEVAVDADGTPRVSGFADGAVTVEASAPAP